MSSRGNIRLFAAVSGVLLAIVAIVSSVFWLWRTAVEIDSKPPRSGLKDQLMHRKTSAMQDILDGMIRGDLGRVETAAVQLAAYGNTIEWYLASTEYQNHGESFRGAVGDLSAAARKRDMDSAKESTLRLERSCIECHILMNQ